MPSPILSKTNHGLPPAPACGLDKNTFKLYFSGAEPLNAPGGGAYIGPVFARVMRPKEKKITKVNARERHQHQLPADEGAARSWGTLQPTLQCAAWQPGVSGSAARPLLHIALCEAKPATSG